MESRGVVILALYPDPESYFLLFVDSGSGFGSIKRQNHNSYRVVMILALNPDLE